MKEVYPDLEIYIKRVETISIIDWLTTCFKKVNKSLIETKNHKLSTTCLFSSGSSEEDEKVTCVIMEKAAKGGFVSVWFKTNQTPWRTDREFALEAFDFFKAEVRCSTGPWEGGDEDGWIRFTEDGEQIVNWLT
ncbi:MAG: hypothetical protein ACI9FB_002353 [Candidatus Azotimanducaceae bacterium]|jgi:hypothetical protein